MSSEYWIKLAAVEEYKQLIKSKNMYEELVELSRAMVMDVFHYPDKHRVDPPNRERIYRNLEKAKGLIEYRIAMTETPTESQQRNKTPDDSTEPGTITIAFSLFHQMFPQ
jgi:hypothetical protein